jgi:hypothetical protein
MMDKITLSFYECEHEGDIQNYMEEIARCGAKIEDYHLDYEEEVGVVSIVVEDKKGFWKKFKETEAYGFLS